jgi:hypothetical protein
MQWVSNVGVRPRPWEIVVARCTGASGDEVEMEAYWTGQVWRILGRKNAMEMRVTMWAYKAEDERCGTISEPR